MNEKQLGMFQIITSVAELSAHAWYGRDVQEGLSFKVVRPHQIVVHDREMYDVAILQTQLISHFTIRNQQQNVIH